MEPPDESNSDQNSSDDQFEEESDIDDESDKVDSDEPDTSGDEEGDAEVDDGDEYARKQENQDERDDNEEEEEDGDEHQQDQDGSDDDSGDDIKHDKITQDEDDSDGNSDDDQSSPSRTKKRKSSENSGLLDLESIKRSKKDGGKKPSKPGIIYLSRIPPFMKPKKLNFIFGQYGDVGRIFLQQEDQNRRKMRKKIGGNKSRKYTEGWIEFKKKKIAKRVAVTFNNTRVGDKKRSRYYDDLWSIKYLPRFNWSHLMERLEYEKQVRQQRIRTEVIQAKKETNFYLKNVEQQKSIDAMKTRKKKHGKDWDFKGRNFKQWKTEEERADDRRMLQEELGREMGLRSGKVNANVLGKIFKK